MRTLIMLTATLLFIAAKAQTSCNSIPMSYRSDSITWQKSWTSFGDSMLSVPIVNTSDSSYAYPQAKLVPITPLPNGLVLNENGGPWNVFASSFVPGDTYPANFFFDVSQPIPANATVTFELWLTNLAPLTIDSCKYDGTFTFNFNPQATGVSTVQENTVKAYAYNGYLFLSSDKNFTNASFTLTDVSGRTVMAIGNLNEAQYNILLPELSGGIYLLNISDNGKPLPTRKLLIN
ncbi:MAG: T9SS type A sorting domain-containing protein [Chitinophagales bacterium]